MKKIRAWTKTIVFITILTLLFINSTFFPVFKSMIIMSVYSQIHENASFLKEEGIDIQMKGGLSTKQKDYYPFVIVFDPSASFSQYIQEAVDLTIYYNFGAFDYRQGTSILYDPNSPFYSSFYGAYAVRYQETDKIYGLTEDQTPDIEAITKITNYDLKHLVYNSLGNMQPNLEYQIKKNEKKMVIDKKEFLVFDAAIKMEGMWHQYLKDYRAYIQYGKPPLYNETNTWDINKTHKSFEEIQGYGRIYLYYDDVDRISYFFYIITADEKTLDYTEEVFIKTAKITKKH